MILKPNAPFTWSSGWKSPIYCDNRLILSYPSLRTNVKQHLVNLVENDDQQVDAIVGVATAGIPHATLLADELNMPLAYVRSSAKKHGTENKIEGHLETGQNVVVIEDLISTGGSSLKAIETIREKGCKVHKLAAIFTYGFDVAAQSFNEQDVPVQTLTDYNILLDVAIAEGYVSEAQLDTLQQWRADPANWGD